MSQSMLGRCSLRKTGAYIHQAFRVAKHGRTLVTRFGGMGFITPIDSFMSTFCHSTGFFPNDKQHMKP